MDAFEFAQAVAQTFGVEPRRHGREFRVPCPVHEIVGMHNPSLAVWEKGPRVHFKCMTGCHNNTVRAALKSRGVAVPGGGRMTSAQMHAAAVANEERRVAALTRARECLVDAKPLALGVPVWAYLDARRLSGIVEHYRTMGKTTLFASDDPLHPGSPALLGVILNLSDLKREQYPVKGIQTLSLLPDGSPRLAAGKKLRSISGQSKGFGVPFGIPSPHLLVAEGIESMLAGMELLDVSFGVAVLSASNMPFLAIPEWVTKVTIVEDYDDAGMIAASDLMRELDKIGGIRIEIEHWVGPPGWDAADELVKRRS